MVKTRHRADPNDGQFSDFISLQSRSTRKRQNAKHEANGFDSSYTDGPGKSPNSPPDYHERRLRTRRHVQIVDQDTSDSDASPPDYRQPTRRLQLRNRQSSPDEERYPDRRTRRSRQPPIQLEEDPSEEEEEIHEEPMERPRRFRRSQHDLQDEEPRELPRRRQRPRIIEAVEDDTEEDDEEEAPSRRLRKYTSSRSPRGKSSSTPGHLNRQLDSGSIRRSTRQKKLLYGTFNQSLIEKHVMLMGEDGEEADEEEQPGEGMVRRRKRKNSEVEPPNEEDNMDMYSRVKRTRRQVKRDMYGIPVNEEDDQQEESGSASDTSEEEEDEENEEVEDKKEGRQYYLRQHKPRTNLYEAPPIEPQKRTRGIFRNDTPPRTFKRTTTYRSPAHKSPRFRRQKREVKKPASVDKKPVEKKKSVEKKKPEPTRRRPAFHGSSSTSSSSSSDSDDERRFERRKAKSMARNRNRCLPMNFTGDEVNKGVLRDRTKVGTSLADIDPMSVDRNVTFDSVGGLGKHIRSLKEMIVFPLLYPEVFERFKISPPRGVLFYGPPGTGKTLVARALANECSTGERKVAFFMRKGADCLSKWVGESERQLRLLFDQAYQMRPSIIFFDEIDGLAPVRSSRQDQIHSSIVSTLLALMDGLDNRGEIVVIGATNRLDSIDPALRRPGRFDREFLFPLPTVEARKQILQIHTKEWNPKLCDSFLFELAENCVGYCGADLKALCTEGALHALRRRYPQIYTSEDKLELDVSAIRVNARDFHKAMQIIVPASQRSVTSPGRALDRMIKPLLSNVFQKILYKMQSIFPTAIAMSNSLDAPATADSASTQGLHVELCSDDEEDDDSHPIYEATGRNGRKKRNGVNNGNGTSPRSFLSFTQSASQHPFTYRPRLLLAGERGQGQSTHLGPALLHQLERLPVHVLDLPTVYAVSAHTPEEACAQIFREARRTSPSIVYMPHIGEWWDVINHTLQATFIALLYDLDPTVPILLVATCETKYAELPTQVKALFCNEEVITMENPNENERREFFEDLLLSQVKKPPSTRKQAAARVLEVLPKAKPAEPRKLTEAELKRVQKQEEKHLRELRLFLRDILNKLGRDRKFGIFAKPVDTEDVPDYYDIIKNPMDLSSMMTKIDLHQYDAVKQFLDDINLICSNALEYNPDRDPSDRAIRHRACALRDTCNALIEAELDPEFEKLCEEIKQARERRGEDSATSVPSYYYTKPIHSPRMGSLSSSPSKYPSRFSRRTRGMDTVDLDELAKNRECSVQEQNPPQDNGPKIRAIVKKVAIRAKFPKAKSPWCRPSRKRFRKVIIYVDEYGNQVAPPGGAGGDNDKPQGGEEDIEQEVSLKEKPDKDEPKPEDDDDQATQASSEATIVQDLEPNDEKENKPVANVQNSPHRSQPASPNVTPPSLRSATRSGRSPSSLGIFTRSTSPRSLSPRGARADLSTDTPRRSTQDISPKAYIITGDSLPRSLSPTVRLRRSSRSSGPETMDTSPSRPSDQQTSEVSAHANPATSPKSNPSSPSAAVATPNSPPSTPLKRSPSAPSTSAATTQSPETSQPSEESQSTAKEAADEDTTEKEEEKKSSPQVRMTRSRSQVPAAVEALAKRVLETETPQTVIVDDDTLRFLLAKVVNVTKNATVEQLEKLYCHLSQAVFAHRQNIDKTELVQELGMIASRFAVHNPSSR